jgi:CRISPR-associated protein Csx17
VVDVELAGCRPEPLAHYLKALAVLRLVAEQRDPDARGFWSGDTFVLRSSQDREDLLSFFLEDYAPTPIVAPWNGGSGFWPKDNREGFDAIRASSAPRLGAYRDAIAAAEDVLQRSGVDEALRKDAKLWKSAKERLIAALRAELPDAALPWMDAALVLTPDGASYPPLLGTGGNDGRLDFSNNQMQRLAALLLAPQGPAPGELASALFGDPVAGLKALTIGQFLPSGIGGTNGGPGFEGRSSVNPWDFVLMVEGALLPSAATTRRLESNRRGALSFPFTVRSSGVGYGSASAKDERGSRDEIWLPLWTAPASLAAVRNLFVEGRAKTKAPRSASTAVTGSDFARALATLGVDRGVDRFVRYGFLQRNGLAFLATPLGVQKVERRALADVLAPLEHWLEGLRRAASQDRAPSSWQRARSDVERAVVDLCTGRARGLLDLLLALVGAERAFARQVAKAVEFGARPVPRLPAETWVPHVAEDSPEFRLARSLAGRGYRQRLLPLAETRNDWDPQSRAVTFGEARLVDNLIATLQRELIERSQGREKNRPAQVHARLDDIDAYLGGRVDDRRLADLLAGLTLLDRHDEPSSPFPTGRSPGAAFALTSLVWDRRPLPGLLLEDTPAVLARLVADRVADATAAAAARLTGAGLPPVVHRVRAARGRGPRLASALAFPLSPADRRELLASLGIPSSSASAQE